MHTTLETVKNVVMNVLECQESNVHDHARLVLDLGADSLDIVDLNYTLGKEFNIKMPTKNIMSVGIELCVKKEFLIKNERLTAYGSKFIRQCPYKYEPYQVDNGTLLIEIFENTNIKNWANLCEAILQSESRNGDIVARDYVEHFFKNNAEIYNFTESVET